MTSRPSVGDRLLSGLTIVAYEVAVLAVILAVAFLVALVALVVG